MSIQPTVTDISRAVAELDAHALDGPAVTDAMRQRIADNIAYRVTASFGNGIGAWFKHSTRSITTRDVRFILASHGATTLTIGEHARAIAVLIRTHHYWGN